MTFVYDIFIGDRENRGLKEKDTASILDFAFIISSILCS